MAQKQQDVKRHGETEEETPPVEPVVDKEAKDKLDADVDDLLDEIDDVLEVNAEDFVRDFIQKGGQ